MALPTLENVCIQSKGTELIPNFLQDAGELQKLYPLIQSFASDPKRKEHPFAQDEFPEEEHFMEYAESGYVLEFRDSASKNVEAYGFLAPSMFHRIQRPLYTEVRVCSMEPVPSVNMLADLLSFILGVAKKLGYMGILMDIFVHDLNTAEAARRNGLSNIMIIPMSGKLPKYGLTEALVFFKSLYSPDKVFPEPDSVEVQHLPEYRFRDLARRAGFIDRLPMSSTLPDGTSVVIRMMEEKHIPIVAKFYEQAVSNGQGFGAGEVPPPELLLEIVQGRDAGHAFAIELTDGRTVATSYIAPSIFCRSHDPSLSDCYVIVDQTFKAKGIATFVYNFWVKISYELGYKGCISDTFLNNIPVIRILRTGKGLMLGTLWRGGHLKGQGFADTISFYKQVYKGDPVQAVLSPL